jgi:AAHS family 4-hydroxybenzoate transporter-like MFS transporter
VAKTLDVAAFIDSRKVSAFQIGIVALCFLVLVVDGFDTASIGFLAPAIREEWGLTPAQLAPLFAAGLFGLMAGAFIGGPLADLIGRKTLLLCCVLFFGLASVVSSHASSIGELVLLRFLTGLGLGGALPSSLTLTSEYCPSARRGLLVTTMYCGFSVGSALGGLVSAHMVGAFGWRSVLLLGGALPLGLAPLLWWKLPESARFIVLKGKAVERLAATFRRIAPQEDFRDVRFALATQPPRASPIARLFQPGLVEGTVLLWVAFFMSLMVIYLLSSWLPTLIRSTGVSLKTASIVAAMFQVGGTSGGIVLGLLMDRFRPQHVLAAAYGCAAVFIALIGSVSAQPWLVAVALFGAGFCISGGQTAASAFTAGFYPTDCRSTGVGWSSGVGRVGSIIGSLLGGLMLSLGWGLPAVFVVAALPALIAAACFVGLGRRA